MPKKSPLIPGFVFFVITVASVFAQDPPLSDYRTKVLTRGLNNPTSIAFLPDGRIYITRKGGSIRLLNPVTGDTSVALSLAVGNAREDGLHSLVLDPAFATNHWVYMLFSNSTRDSIVVARFTADPNSGTIGAGTRQTLLQVPYTINTSTAEHNTGTLAFGPEGNLYIGLADNTQNIFSGTGADYAPRDTARPLYDAQRTAANTNDFRGKILRIRPEANGTYSIPAGNLKDSINLPGFNPNWNASEDDLSKVRPEIFIMGLRHPFRLTVDQQTGWLYWAEPGPNAASDDASQGPRGYEIVGLAKGPGYYGWPYCRANPSVIQKPAGITGPYCYTQYNYSGSGTAGPMYNPNALRNTSKNNTGIVNLPPARTTQVWYPYNSTGTAFPMFGSASSNAGMLGPIYRYNPALSANRLPAAFDRNIFIIEWQRNLIFAGKLDSAGGIQNVRSFWSTRDSTFNGPIDIKVGPDGALYMLNWVGNTYTNNAGNGTLSRLEYTGVQVALTPGAKPRTLNPSGSLFVFAPGSRFLIPAGSGRADFYAVTGQKLWSFHRADVSTSAFISLPDRVQGVVKVKVGVL